MTNFEALLRLLTRNEVEFVVIGGAAAIIHGSTRLTQDLDILYRRSDANLGRLASALASIRPYLRGAAPGLPFVWDKTTLARGLNFTLVTELGDLDLFGEIPGGGDYDAVAGEAIAVEIFGSRCRCLSLAQLKRSKRAAGRPKDLEALAELESIGDENLE